jgi:hypothetical protein
MQRHVATLGLVLAAALPARGAEFIPGWDVDLVYDSNVLHQVKGEEEGDWSVRTGPDLEVRNPLGDLTYDFKTQIRYENFGRLDAFDTNTPSDFDYFGSGSGSWSITDRTRLSVSDDFAYSSNFQSILETIPVAAEQISTFIPRRERIKTNNGIATLTHRLGPLWELTGQFQHTLYDYATDLQTDETTMLGLLQITRSLSPRLVVGAGGQVQRQEFAGISGGGNGTGTNFYQGFGVVQYRFSRTLYLTGNAGPAWSVPDSAGSEIGTVDYRVVNPVNCPAAADGARIFNPRISRGGCTEFAQWRRAGFPFTIPIQAGVASAPQQTVTSVPFSGDAPSGGLSYFGRLTLSQTWRNFSGDVGVSRSASTGSGVNGSTIVTAFTSNLRWFPTRNWSFTLNGTYTQQVAANKIPEQLIVLDPAPGLVPNQLFAFQATQGGGFVPVPCATPSASCLLFAADPVGVPREVRTGNEISNAIDITSWRVELRGERQLSKHLSLRASAAYWNQKSQNDVTTDREQEDYRVVFGFNWTFDPISL